MSAPVDAARALVSTRLPSWRPGSSRDAVLTFLDDLDHVPIDERVAYIDNDGTMWCEKPTYVQFDFFVDALQRRVDADPSMADRPEFAAVLAGDMAAIGGDRSGQCGRCARRPVRRRDTRRLRSSSRRLP